MGYYIRILSPSNRRIPCAELCIALAADFPRAVLTLEAGSDAEWEQLVLCHAGGSEIAAVEFNAVGPNSLCAEELKEFNDEIAGCEPHSAVEWLTDYFSRVQSIYVSNFSPERNKHKVGKSSVH